MTGLGQRDNGCCQTCIVRQPPGLPGSCHQRVGRRDRGSRRGWPVSRGGRQPRSIGCSSTVPNPIPGCSSSHPDCRAPPAHRCGPRRGPGAPRRLGTSPTSGQAPGEKLASTSGSCVARRRCRRHPWGPVARRRTPLSEAAHRCRPPRDAATRDEWKRKDPGRCSVRTRCSSAWKLKAGQCDIGSCQPSAFPGSDGVCVLAKSRRQVWLLDDPLACGVLSASCDGRSLSLVGRLGKQRRARMRGQRAAATSRVPIPRSPDGGRRRGR